MLLWAHFSLRPASPRIQKADWASGRVAAPDWSRECTLSCRTRGDTTESHGPLQRLLGLKQLSAPGGWVDIGDTLREIPPMATQIYGRILSFTIGIILGRTENLRAMLGGVSMMTVYI